MKKNGRKILKIFIKSQCSFFKVVKDHYRALVESPLKNENGYSSLQQSGGCDILISTMRELGYQYIPSLCYLERF